MRKNTIKLSISAATLATGIALILLNACTKDKTLPATASNNAVVNNSAINQQPSTLTQVLTIAHMRTLATGMNQVMFTENAEVFNVTDNKVWTALQSAYSTNSKVKAVFNPWQAVVLSVSTPTSQEIINVAHGTQVSSTGMVIKADQLKNMSDDDLNNSAKLGLLDDGANKNKAMTLKSVIPNMAEAEAIFNYIARQCCKLAGPYDVDYCISFQYCEDGCYARAQKMGWIFNNTYHYSMHKIFSFANMGNDELSVEAEKWGGCCINWWYHVAPLLNIQTPTGIKAYVYDPAMFDQPVPLSVWLHAQENPACAGSYTPHVSMINLQPQVSYSPSDYTGYNFDTDPYFYSTDYTLSNYASLATCP